MKKMLEQIVKFGFVGAFCFVIDFAITMGLTYIGVYHLIAAAVAFVISVVVNYLLSFKFVFERKQDMDRRAEFIIFVILSVIGLGLNELFIWLAVDVVYMHSSLLVKYIDYNIAVAGGKIFATGLVMIYNFVTRKIFLDQKNAGKDEDDGKKEQVV